MFCTFFLKPFVYLRLVCSQKSESEETEIPKPHIKLRRSVSEAPRPASTPPTVAGDREDREVEQMAADLEVASSL